LVPTFSNKNLPLDVIEALAWGTDLSWGWDKHPPLSVFFQKFSIKFLAIKTGLIIY
jgi:hypothetical protein